MYGEKVEEADELRLDLQDVKDMYKGQVSQLANRNRSYLPIYPAIKKCTIISSFEYRMIRFACVHWDTSVTDTFAEYASFLSPFHLQDSFFMCFRLKNFSSLSTDSCWLASLSLSDEMQ